MKQESTQPEPGTATRNDVLTETPEEKEERIERDIEAGLRAPPPEAIDQTKSAVTGEQVQAMADAAPQPHKGGNGDEKESHPKNEKKHATGKK